MSYKATVLNVLVVSPSDVAAEREIVFKIIQDWNAANSQKSGIILLPSADALNIKIDENLWETYDILAAVFWTKLSVNIGDTNKIVDIIKGAVNKDKTALFYFSAQPVLEDSIDIKQYKMFKKFKDKCKDEELFESYESIAELSDKFCGHLRQRISELPSFKSNNTSLKSEQSSIKNENSLLNNEHPSYVSEYPSYMSEYPLSINDDKTDNDIALSKKIEKKPSLSENASVLIKEASRDENFSIMRKSSINSTIIRTNKKNFVINNDKFDIVRWEAAIRELEYKGLIIDKNATGEIYKLTDEGKRIAELI